MGFDGGGECRHGGEFAKHRGEPGVATGGAGSDEREGGVEDAEDEGDFATGGVDHFSGCASACLVESVGSEFGRAGEGAYGGRGELLGLGGGEHFLDGLVEGRVAHAEVKVADAEILEGEERPVGSAFEDCYSVT